jgi:hypothetical protein
MTSKIKVDNIENQCGGAVVTKCGGTTTISGTVVKSNTLQASDAGNIISQSGTTITLGASGDTINLASGATQSGFGREGSVDWQTSIKTATFTAVSGEGYFCNTSGGAFTVNLPSSPSVGDIVAIKDYASSFDTQNLTIGRGGSNMNGSAADSIRNTENESLTLVYADATKGWLAVEEGTGFVGEGFITATGGTITCCGNYKVHTFTGPGTFCVSQTATTPSNNSVDYLVVAGGGGGSNNPPEGQGGGGGGFRTSNSTCMPAPLTSPLANPTGITITAASFPVTVGGGGSVDANGVNSSGLGITSAGGGRAGGDGGGSGGGGPAGVGNKPPVSPPQGQAGGPGNSAGGGGAGAVGGTFSPPNTSGGGGDGSFVFGTGFGGCNGTPGPVGSTRYFAGGGAGGYPVGRPSGIAGGAGGGGYGGEGGVPAGAGATNTGGGGGGTASGNQGRAGGSGIVIIRYKFQ